MFNNMFNRDKDKTIVERRNDTEVFRSGTSWKTRITVFIVILIAVGVFVNVTHLFGH